MDKKIAKLEDAVANLIAYEGNFSTERDFIEEKVRLTAAIVPGVSEEIIETVVKRLEERFNVTMSLGALFAKEEHRPWLDARRGEIDWYFSDRYQRYLSRKNFPRDVITGITRITDRILDHMEDPSREGNWACKGLVVGNVQSGKTANYIDVICKAADAGYKVIIVMAGMLNSLRNQTQIRIEDGFTGVDSLKKFNSGSLHESFTGVGLYDRDRRPITFTTRKMDFSKNVASQISAGLSSFNEPVLLVIKKNSSILKNLKTWIKGNNLDLENLPLLMIDDEADQASVNTKKDREETTAINRNIRQLLNLFTKSTYLGYTATPFANIFIDPDGSTEMLGDELFPSDFIISLDPPSNYFGASRIFGEDSDLNAIREVSDFCDLIPRKHDKTLSPPELPASLREAVRAFILVRAIRILRGHLTEHNSMLVNVSMFTDVQSCIANHLHNYVKELFDAVFNHASLPLMRALKSSCISDIHETWKREFFGAGFNWPDVQATLKKAVAPIAVVEVNSSRNSEPLDYSSAEYPNGRNLIAVGGFSLSRGLTLEGLSVSYFLRNSKMYDTLLQMGRWFGYRPEYDDLCRIYMPPESVAWYRYISGVTEELRDEFVKMSNMKMTPKEFGLAVRTHPDSLLITARNKMRTGKKITRKIDLNGRLIETTVIGSSDSAIAGNFKLLNKLMSDASNHAEMLKVSYGYLFPSIPYKLIDSFVSGYNNHPASMKTEPKPLSDFIRSLSESNVNDRWDVLFVSPEKSLKGKESKIVHSCSGLSIQAQWRKVAQERAMGVAFNQSRVGSRGHEQVGLTETQLNMLVKKYGKRSNIPAQSVRETRDRPLLMIHVVDCRVHENEKEPFFTDGAVAYGISFPGKSDGRKQGKLVEYMVNTVWWNTEYADTLDVEEEIDD